MIDASHIPVLPKQTLACLSPAKGERFVDATVGLGGHAELILRAVGPQGLLIGLDVDPSNLLRAKERLSAVGGNFRLFHANFAELPEVLSEVGQPRVDGILADLGVASSQLDDAARGLSFQRPGPLDMRLDPRLKRTAADFVNSLPEAELADLIFQFGGEHFSRKIARAICRRRLDRRVETTEELAAIVAQALGVDPHSRKSKIHPATRTFQALRIAVNEELESLARLLDLAPDVLAVGGRIAIISFHSLEDRLVKRSFQDRSARQIYRIVTKKPIQPEADESASNPRSRSAKLRAAVRLAGE